MSKSEHSGSSLNGGDELSQRTQEAMRESEARFRALVTASSYMVYRMSSDWSEMRQLQGPDFNANTEWPNRDWLQEYIHPDDQPRVMEAANEAVRNKSIFELEHRVWCADGTLRWTHSRAIPLLDADGEITEWLGAASDVTERKRTEEALRESEQRFRALSRSLERQVEAHTSRLGQQAVWLRHLAAELTSVEQRERKHLATILHDDLQQLLVAAKMRLGEAHSQIRDPAARSALESVADLLSRAMTSSRDLTRELRPPALYEGGLTSGLRWLASELLRLHGLHVVIDVEKDAECPLGDDLKALLFESVRELLFNVVKHAGVKEAAVRVRRSEQRLQIAVEDEGVGFDIDAAAQEPDRQPSGIGLLNIREQFVALGGDVAPESAPGTGTRIKLTVSVGQ